MSDFLSPAINARIKEKNMDFNERFDEIFEDLMVGHNFEYAAKALRTLFLDTIEKAKPEKQEDAINILAQPIGGRADIGAAREAAGFNHGVSVFEERLVKEIKK